MPKIKFLTNLSVLTPGIDRSQGVHLTDIMTRLKWDLYQEAWGAVTQETPLTWEMGFIWERLLSQAMCKEGLFRPPPIQLDGIWCSPDAIDAIGALSGTGKLTLVEDKCTARSAKKHEILDDWWWVTQSKAYCKVLGCNQVLFRILYYNGDYTRKPGHRKIEKYALITYTEQEINDNWSLILNYALDKGIIAL